MIRLYFQQALYHLRENPIITWVSVLGTALAICMIMVLVITFQVRLVDCEPEVNRSRSLYVSAMSVKNKGGSDGDSSNARMSVRTGRECFKSLTTAEAVTLVSLPERYVCPCRQATRSRPTWCRRTTPSGISSGFAFSAARRLPRPTAMPECYAPC